MPIIGIAYQKEQLRRILYTPSATGDYTIGLTFGRSKDAITDSEIGVEHPFTPSIYRIYDDGLDNFYEELETSTDSIPVGRHGPLATDGPGDGAYDTSAYLTPLEMETTRYFLEFSNPVTNNFNLFSFAYFSREALESIFSYTRGDIILSGSLIVPGDRGILPDDHLEVYFTLKLGTSEPREADGAGLAGAAAAAAAPAPGQPDGNPEMLLGIPCPPTWRTV